ncbi:hypothetical protein FOWG_16927 [Fusarium oxysporum f. sp. lycopersici MN25]|nr:hypothetical protein FOWG_16927 [Fusarium oxysporum f. sp. lycopersici MN25]
MFSKEYPDLGITIATLPSQDMDRHVLSTNYKRDEVERAQADMEKLPKPTEKELDSIKEDYKKEKGEDFPYSQDRVRVVRRYQPVT